jgi:hypothetical protein
LLNVNKNGESEVSLKVTKPRKEKKMTHQIDYTLPNEVVEQGLEAVPELMRILINNVMQVERSKYLQADDYERTEERIGHSNGYKPKTVRTRMGEITFSVPQVREGGFYPAALEKGLRSERALVTALAEMYVQGVSTRKVKAITEKLCGTEVSAMQVSRAAAQLDGVLQEWRERPLGEITYLYVDARYEKVREASQVRDAAVLVASGITPEGERQVLGVSVSLSEHETHWKTFLTGLKDRGLNGVKLVTPALAAQVQVSVMTTPVWERLEELYWGVSPGRDASSTCSRMPGLMYPNKPCGWRLQQIFAPCSMHQTERPLRSFSTLPSRNMLPQLRSCLPGWKITLLKALRCSTFLWNIGVLPGPPIVWNGSTRRSADVPGWWGFSQMRLLASGWSPLS